MEYSHEFATRLIESAEALFENLPTKDEAERAVLYLSCVSCEISFKALLEKVGYTPKELRHRSHKLNSLLNEASSGVFNETGGRATSIREKIVVSNTANGTVGTLLTAEISGASVYPNEIRYGDVIIHYSPETMLNCAKVVNQCSSKHGESICRA